MENKMGFLEDLFSSIIGPIVELLEGLIDIVEGLFDFS